MILCLQVLKHKIQTMGKSTVVSVILEVYFYLVVSNRICENRKWYEGMKLVNTTSLL